MSDPIPLDSGLMGRQGLQSPWLIPGERPTIIDPGPANRAVEVDRLLRGHGVEELGAIVLTHIHFDHAGGAAELATLNPGAKIYVHPRVAGLLVDPAGLNRAVSSVWGEATEDLFGFPKPAPEDSVVAVAEGDPIELGGGRSLEVMETPGHTRAHLAFIDRSSDSVFCGDAVAIQMGDAAAVRPSTPPSDYGRASMEESIERLRGVGAGRLLLPHFGEAQSDPDTMVDLALESLARWHEAFEEIEPGPDAAAALLTRAEGEIDPAVLERFEMVNPGWLNLAGLEGENQRLSAAES
ncbi:MAG: MBL fold metallo-hydrolase [Solirubrobacterales bacterium]